MRLNKKEMRMNNAGWMVVAGALLCVPVAHAYQEGDFQIWHTESQDVALMKGAKIAGEEEFRYWNNAAELCYQHYDLGLVLGLTKHLDVGLFYRQIYERKKTGGKFMPEACPNVNATLKFDAFGFPIESRNRFEYRHFNWQDDNCRYRNKFVLKTPWKLTPLKISPYLSDEIFVRIDDSAVFNQNRFSSGLTMEFWNNVKGDVYYLLKCDRGRVKWTDAHILGLKLKISF